MVLWTSTTRNVIFIVFIDLFFKPAEDAEIGDHAQQAVPNAHKRPVVSHSKGHQPSTVTSPMKIQSWLWFTLSFPRCITNPFTQAKLQARRPFLFLNGGCSGGETEGPKQKGGSKEVWELESELCGPHTELPSTHGRGWFWWTEKLCLAHHEADVNTHPRCCFNRIPPTGGLGWKLHSQFWKLEVWAQDASAVAWRPSCGSWASCILSDGRDEKTLWGLFYKGINPFPKGSTVIPFG